MLHLMLRNAQAHVCLISLSCVIEQAGHVHIVHCAALNASVTETEHTLVLTIFTAIRQFYLPWQIHIQSQYFLFKSCFI